MKKLGGVVQAYSVPEKYPSPERRGFQSPLTAIDELASCIRERARRRSYAEDVEEAGSTYRADSDGDSDDARMLTLL